MTDASVGAIVSTQDTSDLLHRRGLAGIKRGDPRQLSNGSRVRSSYWQSRRSVILFKIISSSAHLHGLVR